MSIAVIECVFCLGLEVSKGQMKAVLDDFQGLFPEDTDIVEANERIKDFEKLDTLLIGVDQTQFSQKLSNLSVVDEFEYYNCKTLEQFIIAYIDMEYWGWGFSEDPWGLILTSLNRYTLLKKKKYSKLSSLIRVSRECVKTANVLYDYDTFLGLSREKNLSLEKVVTLLAGNDEDSLLHIHHEDDFGGSHYYGLQIVSLVTEKIISMAKDDGFQDKVEVKSFLRWADKNGLLFDEYLLSEIKDRRSRDQGVFAQSIIQGVFSEDEIKRGGIVNHPEIKKRIRGRELPHYGLIDFENSKYKSKSTGDEVTVKTLNTRIRKLREDKGT